VTVWAWVRTANKRLCQTAPLRLDGPSVTSMLCKQDVTWSGSVISMVEPEETHKLPVRRFAQDIARAVREHDVIVVLAETGSGKTTQIPQVPLLAFIHYRLA